ncbi:5'-AMP-activated protein kinase subunit gamma-2 [Larimichthys crocea]|uniref:Uncharacterized protein n=1 Tax=Larimichthys crocea TaxID=215358 RepID=A0ACD3QRI2_LARCR|nr:5'-AMP-activated protein kinase subunit gamma-2 [Larimichthys crocea]
MSRRPEPFGEMTEFMLLVHQEQGKHLGGGREITVTESNKESSKKMPKKRRSLRINMPDFGTFTSPQVETSGSTKSGAQTGERRIRSASPIKGVSSPASALLPPCPQSAPVPAKPSSGSPKTIFPYPSHQDSPPKSPRRLSISGIFRSSSSSSPTSIKIFSRTRRASGLSTPPPTYTNPVIQPTRVHPGGPADQAQPRTPGAHLPIPLTLHASGHRTASQPSLCQTPDPFLKSCAILFYLTTTWMMKISFIQVLILEHTVYQQGCVCNSGRAEGVNIISASRQYLTQRWMTD